MISFPITKGSDTFMNGEIIRQLSVWEVEVKSVDGRIFVVDADDIVKDPNNFLGSTKEFADLVGVDYPTATGIIKLLVAKGIAKNVGYRPNGGRGKPSTVFSIPKGNITLCFIPLAAA